MEEMQPVILSCQVLAHMLDPKLQLLADAEQADTVALMSYVI